MCSITSMYQACSISINHLSKMNLNICHIIHDMIQPCTKICASNIFHIIQDIIQPCTIHHVIHKPCTKYMPKYISCKCHKIIDIPQTMCQTCAKIHLKDEPWSSKCTTRNVPCPSIICPKSPSCDSSHVLKTSKIFLKSYTITSKI